MPMFEYSCECGAKAEHLHRFSDTSDGCPPDAFYCPKCDGGLLKRHTVYRIQVLGPVFEHMESMNKALLTSKQRKAGKELKTAKDIERYEQEHNLYRPEAHTARIQLQEQAHDAACIELAAKGGGLDGALDYIDTTEIMEATGWDKSKTTRWKDTADAASRAIADGRVDVDAIGTNPNQDSSSTTAAAAGAAS